MEPKNVMLLGFVNKAVEYLNKHLDDTSLAELKNIDLDSLKEKLGEELKDTLDDVSETAETLMAAGREAFDRFVNTKKKENELSDEFDRLFDVDLDEEEETKVKDDKEELEDLLSYYDLSKNDEADEKFLEEETQEVPEEEVPAEEVSAAEETVNTEAPEEVPETEEEKELEEEIPYELDEEETKMLELIARNVNKKDDKRSQEILTGANKELDSIFSELVAAEDQSSKKTEEVIPEEEAETETAEKAYEPLPINQIQELSFEQVFEQAKQETEKEKEKELDQIPEEERAKIIENPLVDVSIAQEEEKIEEEEKEKEEERKAAEPVYPEQVDKDDIIKLMKDIQPLSDVYYNKIENFIDEQEAKQKTYEDEEDESSPRPVTREKDENYISSLIDDLKSKLDKEEVEKRRQEEEFREVYDKIHKAYPYLSNGFIRNVYDLKETIAKEYPLGEQIIILHRSIFHNVENLRQYVEIMLNHGYQINADEKQMIVDAFKQHINTDGKVITSIFEVANQSALLSGDYEGYRVLFEDDLK